VRSFELGRDVLHMSSPLHNAIDGPPELNKDDVITSRLMRTRTKCSKGTRERNTSNQTIDSCDQEDEERCRHRGV